MQALTDPLESLRPAEKRPGLLVRVPGTKLRDAAARAVRAHRQLRPKGMSGRQWRKLRKAEQLGTAKQVRRRVYERMGFYA